MLVQVQGKGTFVSAIRRSCSHPSSTRASSTSCQERVRKLKFAAVDMQTVPASPDLVATLRLAEGPR
jgi:DNA-binding GntR family transcriptional regulator